MTIKATIFELSNTREESSIPGILLRRLLPELTHDLYIGVELPDKRPVLLIHIPKNFKITGLSDLSTRYISVERCKLPDSPKAYETIIVRLTDDAFLDQFCFVIEDYLVVASALQSPEQLWHVLRSRLQAWRYFFSNPDGMSLQQQRGLIGELAALKLIASLYSWSDAISYWTGPKADDRDFCIGTAAIEVKTNQAMKRDLVTISNEHQLDLRNNSKLYLWVFSLGKSTSQHLTLPGYVNSVRHLLINDPATLVRFEELLVMTGYSDEQFSSRTTDAYSIEENRLYAVREGFPRIVANKIPVGVSHVSYDISLSQLSEWIVEIQNISANNLH